MTQRNKRRFRDPGAGRLQLEPLEDRRLLAALTVNSALDNVTPDDNLVTLREAVQAANNDTITDLGQTGNGVDTILFDPAVFSTQQTIALALGEIVVNESVTLDGPGQSQLTIDAQQQSRIFDFTATTGDLTVAGVTLTGGKTTADSLAGRGGAIRLNTTGTLTVDRSTISGNNTEAGYADGGAIYTLGGVTLTSSTVSGNSTDGFRADGGAIFARGAVTLTGSTLSGNQTTADFGRGGGILSVGPVTLVKSTVSGNSTAGIDAYGGGIFVLGTVTVTHSTVTDNRTIHATADGGGFWNDDDTFNITNSIIAANTAGGSMNDIEPRTGAMNVNFSLIGDTSGLTITGGNNITNVDPQVKPLANNGGPTQTHELLVGSPAIDAGDPAVLFNANDFDQRAAPFVRVFDGDGVGAARIDIGAYERQTLAANFFVVDTIADELDGDYSAGNVSLREAISAANSSPGADTITFDASVFATQQIILLGLGQIEITEAVTIDATSLTNNVTIDANNASRIFNITATTGDFTLAGLTLTGGQTIGDNVNFEDTTFRGGAVRSLTTGNLTIDQSTVGGNSTAGDRAAGGGIFSAGAVTLTNSTVSGNSTAGYFAIGGGISSRGTVTLNSSTVSGNNTAGSVAAGGGISSSGTVTLTSSTVSGNSTAGDEAEGGGIYSYSAVTLTSSTISGNSAAGEGADGGGIFSFGAVTLTSSTVSGNSTEREGADGGGIFSFGAVTLNSSTVTNNRATYSNATGGGIWNNNDTITITNSILAGNTAGGGSPDINPGTGIFAVDFSLLGTAVTPDPGGSGNLFSDVPLLGLLANNGGPTETHAPLFGSPAIDAGDPNFPFDVNEFDQRGTPFLRVFGNPLAPRIDIGAYEAQTLGTQFFVVTTTSDELDYSNSAVSLREAVNSANGSVGADTITFDAALSGQLITLGGAQIEITEAVTIDATALAANVTVDANLQSRIFDITATTGDFTLAGLTLTGGRTTDDNLNAADLTHAGGGIRFLSDGELTLASSTVSGNSTAGFLARGGGIFSLGAVSLMSSTVSGNSTAGNYAHGGGIYTSSGAVTLTSSTVSGNSTAGFGADGGGIHFRGSTVTLTSSTVSGNSTTGDKSDGGAIYSQGAVTLTSSTVSGNSTAGLLADGGGIYSKGAVTLMHSTMTDNHATGVSATAGGLWNLDDPVVIDNSIVAGNTASGGMNDIAPGTGALNVDFSLIEQTGLTISGSDNVIGMPADVGPLADNGGSTQTHELLAGSAAIDAGDPGIAFNPSEFDQRGAPFLRVVDGDADAIARIDMGSYELQATVVDGDFNDDGLYDCLDIDALVAEIASGSNASTFDLTQDGAVDLADRDAWLAEAGEINLGPGKVYLLGDADLDGTVDGLDFIRWNANKFTNVNTWCGGDFNADGVVDGLDYILWNGNKFQASASSWGGIPLESHRMLSGAMVDLVLIDTNRSWLEQREFSLDTEITVNSDFAQRSPELLAAAGTRLTEPKHAGACDENSLTRRRTERVSQPGGDMGTQQLTQPIRLAVSEYEFE